MANLERETWAVTVARWMLRGSLVLLAVAIVAMAVGTDVGTLIAVVCAPLVFILFVGSMLLATASDSWSALRRGDLLRSGSHLLSFAMLALLLAAPVWGALAVFGDDLQEKLFPEAPVMAILFPVVTVLAVAGLAALVGAVALLVAGWLRALRA